MSLVNDALRRAKEAQRPSAPPPSPQIQFWSVEPAQHPAPGLGLVVPAALAVVALLTILLIRQVGQGHKAIVPLGVRALTPPPAVQPTNAPQPVTPPSEVAAAPVQASPPPQLSPQSVSVSGVTNPIPGTAPTMPDNPPTATAPENDVTNTVAVIAPPPPKLPPLKLQAIVFNPKRPSVLINGRSLFVGEKLGDLRVVAIDRESATLVGAGQTNTLTMAE